MSSQCGRVNSPGMRLPAASAKDWPVQGSSSPSYVAAFQSSPPHDFLVAKCMQQQRQRIADLNDTDDIRATRSRVQLPWRPSSPFQRFDGVHPRSGTNAANIDPLLPALDADHRIEVSCQCFQFNASIH